MLYTELRPGIESCYSHLNQGKLKEFETLLAPLNWQFYSLQDLGIDSPIEDGASFYENALIKAKHAATISGFPAIADDSGLCVDSLSGAPGLNLLVMLGKIKRC